MVYVCVRGSFQDVGLWFCFNAQGSVSCGDCVSLKLKIRLSHNAGVTKER